MKQMLCMLSFAVGILSSCSSNLTHSEFFTPVNENTLRAPAYPLVTIDPYTSAWSIVPNARNSTDKIKMRFFIACHFLEVI